MSRFRNLSRARAGALLGIFVVGVTSCSGGARSPSCAGYDALVDALRAVALAESAVGSGDDKALEEAMDDVERYVRLARGRLSGADADPTRGASARALLEAANYLDFMVGDFRARGRADFSLTQFASRELNRAAAGAGGAPLNC